MAAPEMFTWGLTNPSHQFNSSPCNFCTVSQKLSYLAYPTLICTFYYYYYYYMPEGQITQCGTGAKPSVTTSSSYFHSFWHNTGVHVIDGRTHRIAASTAPSCQKMCKTLPNYFLLKTIEYAYAQAEPKTKAQASISRFQRSRTEQLI